MLAEAPEPPTDDYPSYLPGNNTAGRNYSLPVEHSASRLPLICRGCTRNNKPMLAWMEGVNFRSIFKAAKHDRAADVYHGRCPYCNAVHEVRM